MQVIAKCQRLQSSSINDYFSTAKLISISYPAKAPSRQVSSHPPRRLTENHQELRHHKPRPTRLYDVIDEICSSDNKHIVSTSTKSRTYAHKTARYAGVLQPRSPTVSHQQQSIRYPCLFEPLKAPEPRIKPYGLDRHILTFTQNIATCYSSHVSPLFALLLFLPHDSRYVSSQTSLNQVCPAIMRNNTLSPLHSFPTSSLPQPSYRTFNSSPTPTQSTILSTRFNTLLSRSSIQET